MIAPGSGEQVKLANNLHHIIIINTGLLRVYVINTYCKFVRMSSIERKLLKR